MSRDTEEGPEPVSRSSIRERLERSRKYWTGPGGRAAAGALADEVLAILHEHGVQVMDDDIQG